MRIRRSIFCVAGRKGWRLHWPHQLHDWQSHRVQEETVSSKLCIVQCLLHLIQISFISHPPSLVWIKRNYICCGTVMTWKVLPHIVTRCIYSWNYNHDQSWSRINIVKLHSSRNLWFCPYCGDLVLTLLSLPFLLQCVQSLSPTSHDVLFCCWEPRGDELVSHKWTPVKPWWGPFGLFFENL